MPVNLFVNLDRADETQLRLQARLAGRSLKERLRERLIECVGGAWTPLTVAEVVAVDRNPNLVFDLRG